MLGYRRGLFGYLEAVFLKSWHGVCTFFDILAIVLFLRPDLAEGLISNKTGARVLGGSLFLASFLAANYSVYRNLFVDGADIRLTIIGQNFRPGGSTRSPFREIQVRMDGYSEEGQPGWATLSARLKMENIGPEDGTLAREVIESKTRLPSLFDCSRMKIELPSSGPINARSPSLGYLILEMRFTVDDPRIFALELKKLSKRCKRCRRYMVVMRYWTKRIGGPSREHKLKIEGDCQEFCEQVLKYWADQGYNELVEIARSS